MAIKTAVDVTARKRGPIRPASTYRLVPAEGLDLIFGTTMRKMSPYVTALNQLKVAPAGQYLEFDNLRARCQISVQARKHGMKVLFAECNNKLYVKLVEQCAAEVRVLDLLRSGPKEVADIGKTLREQDGTVTDADVKLILQQLSDNQHVALRSTPSKPGAPLKYLWHITENGKTLAAKA